MKLPVCILIASVIFLFSGCALFSPKPFSPLTLDYPGDLFPSDILRVLKERHGSYSHLWANGGITLSGAEIKGKKFFQATLLYQAPLRLRLRGSRMITSTLFEFIIHGDKIALVWNRERKWFQGTREELEKHPEATFGMDPLLLPQALLIQQEFIRLLGEGRFEKWRRGEKDYAFVTKDPEPRAFLVRKKDLLVREAVLYSKEGRQNLRLRFKRYAFSNGDILPVELEAYFPGTGMTARIEIKEYKHPEIFQDAVFDMTPPPGFERYSLKDLLESPSM
jgi:hypothetical protein